MPPASQHHRLLASRTRSKLIETLRVADRPLGVTELADAVGLHSNTVREQLTALVDAGLVRSETAATSGRGRPSLRYSIRPGLDPGEPYRALARALADQLAQGSDPAGAALQAGERWGRSLVGSPAEAPTGEGAVAELIDLLDDAGFGPETPTAGSGSIPLRRCPFDPLARPDPTIVCGVHLGLMRGAMAKLGGPVTVDRLEPFVTPDLCLVHVSSRDHA